MSSDKQRILAEIKRLANANGGKAPGKKAFENATGIRESAWQPTLWLRWSEAIEEAGLTKNKMVEAIDDNVLLEQFARLAQRLSHLPVRGEMRREVVVNPSFPNEKTFRRLGEHAKFLELLADFCRTTSGFDDVLAMCEARSQTHPSATTEKVTTGFVYLMKSGSHYKIGRTKALGRRQWELSIKIPVPPRTLHYIETDDPVGVEAYWHHRFDDKRGEGEWFSLDAADVQAFKRWKRLV